MVSSRKKLRNTLLISAIVIIILATLSAALKAFMPIEEPKYYNTIQAVLRSLVLFFLLVFFSSLQQLRRKVAGIIEFFLSRLIASTGFGITLIQGRRIEAIGIYLLLAILLSAYVLSQGLEIK